MIRRRVVTRQSFLDILSSRFNQWVTNLLESGETWGFVRFLLILLSFIGLVLFGAFMVLLINPGSASSWWETGGLARVVPAPILRYFSLIFSEGLIKLVCLPVIPLSIALMVGGRFIQDVYELGSFGQGVKYLLICLGLWEYPVLRIQGDKPVLEPGEVNLLDRIGGPGYLFISPGSAVMIERMSRPSKVLTEGKIFITRYERIGDIIDLGDQHGEIKETRAMSKDGIMVKVHDIQYRYRLAGGRRRGGIIGRTQENPYPFSPKAVFNVAYGRPMIKSGVANRFGAIQSMVEREITGYIRRHLLDDVIYTGEGAKRTRDEIRSSILSARFRDTLRGMGTELLWFDIGHFSYEDPDVEDRWIKVWAAEWAGQADVKRAQGEAERDAAIAIARADVQKDILEEMVYAMNQFNPDQIKDKENLMKLFLFKVGDILDAMTGSIRSLPEDAPKKTDDMGQGQ